jgi:hypothetical protein
MKPNLLSPSKIAGLGAVTGPLFLATGWLALARVTDEEPGFGWRLSHVLFLVGVVAFVPAVLGLGHLSSGPGGRWGVTGVGLAILGCLALSGEYAINFAGAQLASDGEEMVAIFNHVLEDPVMAIPPSTSCGPSSYTSACWR